MARLLDGIKVLDLTNVLAGPLCGYQLAQAGAEVIKVEVPGDGDLARQLGASPELNKIRLGASFLAQNAGKKSVTLDFKNAPDKALFLKLVEEADVLLENFRPGVMARLGLGAKELQQVNPGLVYCAISGFGQTGPLATNPAYDQIIQGLSGAMSVTGDATSGPLRAGYPASDTIGGLTAAFAVSAALVRKARTGEGEIIDVSMLEATMVAMGWNVSNYLIAGVEPTRRGNDNMTAAPSGTFQTKQGLLNIAANQQAQFAKLCEIVGRPELLDDPRFAEREARKQYRSELTAELEAALATESSEYWSNRLNAAGVPAGQVLTLPEALSQPQILERNFISEFEVEGISAPVRVMRSGYRLSSGDPAPDSPAPLLGQHNDEILGPLKQRQCAS
ncbi:CoA transferase [Devosia sp. MC521]|uniref:CaiB/BaiF CoA transferase family protein n=1 Tax=Devosia sp. MC521 TaxID=2759954 RepID=UPI0015F95D7B|nr:CoA transferase [Devosia sp. MC521]MBJ6988429.1 CoA transferase [Devosia sp. MC521]QMW62474.1 CoA transferase [Devosia sp. MC521]